MKSALKQALLASILLLFTLGIACASVPVNINTATAQQLQSVKGIGPQTAEKIIAYRTTHGKFSSVEQLSDIKGIGASSLAKMSNQLCVQ